jgi:hypothetical protein
MIRRHSSAGLGRHESCRTQCILENADGRRAEEAAAIFYRAAGGQEPVWDWLRQLCQADRRAVGHDVGKAEFGWPVGMPLCRSRGDGL